MANNPFSDISALKSLKKELEKQDAPATPRKQADEPRKKTVTHKSKEDILGEQKARETGLQPGLSVRKDGQPVSVRQVWYAVKTNPGTFCFAEGRIMLLM